MNRILRMTVIAIGVVGVAAVLGVALVVSVNIMAVKQVEALVQDCHSHDDLHAPTARSNWWLDLLNPSKAEAFGGDPIPLVDPEDENDDNEHRDRHAHRGVLGTKHWRGHGHYHWKPRTSFGWKLHSHAHTH